MARSDKRVARGGDGTSAVSGRRPVLEFLKAGKEARTVLISRDLKPSSIIGEIRKRADRAGIPVRVVAKTEVDRSAGATNHQGVVAVTGPYGYARFEELLEGKRSLLFLDGVTDPHNLGSLLRSADGSGMGGVVLPLHRSVAVTTAVRRVSAGAAEIVPVARVTNLGRAVDQARESGLWVVGLDAAAEDDIYSSEVLSPPVGLVLGSEEKGISPSLLGRCDGVARIPSSGRIASLNVAVAGAIAMFELVRRDTSPDSARARHDDEP